MKTSSLVFANEKAKIAWEVGQQLARFASELPSETPSMDAKAIRFDSTHRTRGIYAILFTGTVVGTSQEGVFVVPERTLLALQKLHIPYQEI